MKKILSTFSLVIIALCTIAAQPLKVGLFYGQEFQRATITLVKGSIDVYIDQKLSVQISAGESFELSYAGSQLRLIKGANASNGDNIISLVSSDQAQFKIQPAGLKANGRLYQGNISAVKAPGRLQLINVLHLESYIPGVIEAEGGANHELEYYKVQAIISRTYAVSNLRRHEAEGYNVCDATHCQVYHGMSRHEPLTNKATRETEDVVIVDQNIDLITAAFHSNCGGHTNNAEDVWSKPLSYCVGRPDTFCLVMPHSNWEKSIPTSQWLAYLEKKRYPETDTALSSALAFFPSQKQVYFVDSTFKIPTKVIRSDFKLKSSYFTVHQMGENITFIGQGFGHGVGLCQEGAIRMAQLGYSHQDIIHYYYKDVHLIPLRFRWFFKEDVY